ncbi:MAG: hypothetical protein KDN05_24750, partial [Verrucomicrobiae bacterium]|nr:hypothetical protein [Verrucomicrobiae bacterium]
NLGEDETTVSAFVRKMGSKMTYRVTVDDEKGTMGKKWLEAAGQNGIPCAFVVNKSGRIAYIGHPMSLEESLLVKLLSEPSTKPAAAVAAPVATAPSEKAEELAARAGTLLRAGKTDEAEKTIAKLHEELGDKFRYIGGLLELDLMLARGETADAPELAKILAEDFAEQAAIGVAAAARLSYAGSPDETMLATAEKLAGPAAQSEGPARCGALSVLARVSFLRGEKDKAVGFQKQAVDCASPAEAAAAKDALSAYQEDKLP